MGLFDEFALPKSKKRGGSVVEPSPPGKPPSNLFSEFELPASPKRPDLFSEFTLPAKPAPSTSPIEPVSLGQETLPTFDESRAMLTWTPPGGTPPVRYPGDQPSDAEMRNEKPLQMPAEVGMLLSGADPLTKAALQAAGAGISALGAGAVETAGKMLTTEAEMVLAKGQPMIEKLAAEQVPGTFLTDQISPTAAITRAPGIKELGPAGMSKLEDVGVTAVKAGEAKAFESDPPGFAKTIDEPPTSPVTNSLTGETVKEPIIPTPPEQVVEKITQAVDAPAIQTADPNLTQKLSLETAAKIKDAALAMIDRNPDFLLPGESASKLYKRMAQGVRENIIGIDSFGPEEAKNMRALGWDNARLAQELEDTASFGGKTLNYLSQVAQKLDQATLGQIRQLPELPPTGWGKLQFLKPGNLLNIWRGELTKQLMTQVRNFNQAGLEFGVQEGLDEAMVGAEKYLFGTANAKEALAGPLEHLWAVQRRFTPEGRKFIQDLLANEPYFQQKLYGTPVSDMLLTKQGSDFWSYGARTQEFFARETVLDARVHQAIIYARKPWADFSAIEKWKALDRGVNDALDVTRATYPQSDFARKFIDVFSFGPMKLMYPFARYMTNAAGSIYKWTPFKPMVMAGKALISDPYKEALLALPLEEKLRVINRGAIGTMILLGAVRLRYSKYAGAHYNEYVLDPDNHPERISNISAFGGIFTAASFVAEAMKQYEEFRDEGKPSNITTQDFVEGLVGINRFAGTTLFLSHLALQKPLESETEEGKMKNAERMLGEFLGGFSTRFKTIRDMIAAFDPEEAKYRDVRQAPISGPFRANIPFLSRTLPEKHFATGTDNERTDPLQRQLTGWAVDVKDPVRLEMDRLRLEPNVIEPQTTIPAMDNAVRLEMSKHIEREIPEFMRSEWYRDRKRTFKEQANELKTRLSEIKTDAIDTVRTKNPEWDKILSEREAEQDLLKP